MAEGTRQSPAEPNLPLEVNRIRMNDGSVHPVSPQWYERNVVKAGVTGENEARRLALLRLTDEHRRSEFRAELAALTEFRNVNRALEQLGGRDYREIFGENATIDQVHVNRVTKECGCELNYIFDHNQRHMADNPIHPHRPTRVCEAHRRFGDDFAAQFFAVMRE